MTRVSRLVPLVGAIALGSILSACSGNSSDGAVGTSGGAPSFISVDTSSAPVIMVENLTTEPLVDVNITLKSGILVFSDSVSRLEAKEKRRLTVGDFTSRDGTALNLRIATPKEVAVNAHDLSGKQFQTTMRWGK